MRVSRAPLVLTASEASAHRATAPGPGVEPAPGADPRELAARLSGRLPSGGASAAHDGGLPAVQGQGDGFHVVGTVGYDGGWRLGIGVGDSRVGGDGGGGVRTVGVDVGLDGGVGFFRSDLSIPSVRGGAPAGSLDAWTVDALAAKVAAFAGVDLGGVGDPGILEAPPPPDREESGRDSSGGTSNAGGGASATGGDDGDDAGSSDAGGPSGGSNDATSDHSKNDATGSRGENRDAGAKEAKNGGGAGDKNQGGTASTTPRPNDDGPARDPDAPRRPLGPSPTDGPSLAPGGPSEDTGACGLGGARPRGGTASIPAPRRWTLDDWVSAVGSSRPPAERGGGLPDPGPGSSGGSSGYVPADASSGLVYQDPLAVRPTEVDPSPLGRAVVALRASLPRRA